MEGEGEGPKKAGDEMAEQTTEKSDQKLLGFVYFAGIWRQRWDRGKNVRTDVGAKFCFLFFVFSSIVSWEETAMLLIN